MVEIVVGHPLDEAGPRTELVGQRLTLASLDRRGGPRELHVRRVDDARHRRRDPSAAATACGCRYGLGAGRSDGVTTRAPSPEGSPRLSQSDHESSGTPNLDFGSTGPNRRPPGPLRNRRSEVRILSGALRRASSIGPWIYSRSSGARRSTAKRSPSGCTRSPTRWPATTRS